MYNCQDHQQDIFFNNTSFKNVVHIHEGKKKEESDLSELFYLKEVFKKD